VGRYAAFLRGVNVGGVSLKMADVAAALGSAGFDDVRTILASGNAVFSLPAGASGDVATIRSNAEAALRSEFGYEAWVLVYELGALQSIADNFPFDPEPADPEVDEWQSYMTFVSDPAVLDELAALAGPDEKIARGESVLYWQVPKSATLDTTIGKTMGKRRYKATTTTRNLRTVNKVLQVGLAG
jgi:uncharacterized protein (DUF1697 family)